MQVTKIIAAGITGTSAMTLFSYIISALKEKNFKEPELLSKLMFRIVPDMKKDESDIAGWNTHYLVGLAFAAVYAQLWSKTKMKPTPINGAILGGLSGLLAIAVWKLTFKAHPAPPKTDYKRYYGHLFVTHIIFGAFASMGYSLPRKKK